jgi:hypothetical protein
MAFPRGNKVPPLTLVGSLHLWVNSLTASNTKADRDLAADISTIATAIQSKTAKQDNTAAPSSPPMPDQKAAEKFIRALAKIDDATLLDPSTLHNKLAELKSISTAELEGIIERELDAKLDAKEKSEIANEIKINMAAPVLRQTVVLSVMPMQPMPLASAAASSSSGGLGLNEVKITLRGRDDQPPEGMMLNMPWGNAAPGKGEDARGPKREQSKQSLSELLVEQLTDIKTDVVAGEPNAYSAYTVLESMVQSLGLAEQKAFLDKANELFNLNLDAKALNAAYSDYSATPDPAAKAHYDNMKRIIENSCDADIKTIAAKAKKSDSKEARDAVLIEIAERSDMAAQALADLDKEQHPDKKNTLKTALRAQFVALRAELDKKDQRDERHKTQWQLLVARACTPDNKLPGVPTNQTQSIADIRINVVNADEANPRDILSLVNSGALSDDMSNYRFGTPKSGGANAAGEFGGNYIGFYAIRGTDGQIRIHSQKVFFKQAIDGDDINHRENMAEVIAGDIMSGIIGDASAAVFFASRPGTPDAKNQSNNVYVASPIFNGYEDAYEASYRAQYKEAHPGVKDEAMPAPPKRPGGSDPGANIQRGMELLAMPEAKSSNPPIPGLGEIHAANLLVGNLQIHYQNVATVVMANGKRRFGGIDFGGAFRPPFSYIKTLAAKALSKLGIYGLSPEEETPFERAIHPHRKIGKKYQANYLLGYPFSIRLTAAYINDFERVANVDRATLLHRIDQAVEKARARYSIEDLRFFAEKMGVPGADGLQTPDDIARTMKSFLSDRLLARQLSEKEYIMQLRLSAWGAKKLATAGTKLIDFPKGEESKIADVDINELISQNPITFLTGDFKFRGEDCKKHETPRLNTEVRQAVARYKSQHLTGFRAVLADDLKIISKPPGTTEELKNLSKAFVIRLQRFETLIDNESMADPHGYKEKLQGIKDFLTKATPPAYDLKNSDDRSIVIQACNEAYRELVNTYDHVIEPHFLTNASSSDASFAAPAAYPVSGGGGAAKLAGDNKDVKYGSLTNAMPAGMKEERNTFTTTVRREAVAHMFRASASPGANDGGRAYLRSLHDSKAPTADDLRTKLEERYPTELGGILGHEILGMQTFDGDQRSDEERKEQAYDTIEAFAKSLNIREQARFIRHAAELFGLDLGLTPEQTILLERSLAAPAGDTVSKSVLEELLSNHHLFERLRDRLGPKADEDQKYQTEGYADVWSSLISQMCTVSDLVDTQATATLSEHDIRTRLRGHNIAHQPLAADAVLHPDDTVLPDNYTLEQLRNALSNPNNNDMNHFRYVAPKGKTGKQAAGEDGGWRIGCVRTASGRIRVTPRMLFKREDSPEKNLLELITGGYTQALIGQIASPTFVARAPGWDASRAENGAATYAVSIGIPFKSLTEEANLPGGRRLPMAGSLTKGWLQNVQNEYVLTKKYDGFFQCWLAALWSHNFDFTSDNVGLDHRKKTFTIIDFAGGMDNLDELLDPDITGFEKFKANLEKVKQHKPTDHTHEASSVLRYNENVPKVCEELFSKMTWSKIEEETNRQAEIVKAQKPSAQTLSKLAKHMFPTRPASKLAQIKSFDDIAEINKVQMYQNAQALKAYAIRVQILTCYDRKGGEYTLAYPEKLKEIARKHPTYFSTQANLGAFPSKIRSKMADIMKYTQDEVKTSEELKTGIRGDIMKDYAVIKKPSDQAQAYLYRLRIMQNALKLTQDTSELDERIEGLTHILEATSSDEKKNRFGNPPAHPMVLSVLCDDALETLVKAYENTESLEQRIMLERLMRLDIPVNEDTKASDVLDALSNRLDPHFSLPSLAEDKNFSVVRQLDALVDLSNIAQFDATQQGNIAEMRRDLARLEELIGEITELAESLPPPPPISDASSSLTTSTTAAAPRVSMHSSLDTTQREAFKKLCNEKIEAIHDNLEAAERLAKQRRGNGAGASAAERPKTDEPKHSAGTSNTSEKSSAQALYAVKVTPVSLSGVSGHEDAFQKAQALFSGTTTTTTPSKKADGDAGLLSKGEIKTFSIVTKDHAVFMVNPADDKNKQDPAKPNTGWVISCEEGKSGGVTFRTAAVGENNGEPLELSIATIFTDTLFETNSKFSAYQNQLSQPDGAPHTSETFRKLIQEHYVEWLQKQDVVQDVTRANVREFVNNIYANKTLGINRVLGRYHCNYIADAMFDTYREKATLRCDAKENNQPIILPGVKYLAMAYGELRSLLAQPHTPPITIIGRTMHPQKIKSMLLLAAAMEPPVKMENHTGFRYTPQPCQIREMRKALNDSKNQLNTDLAVYVNLVDTQLAELKAQAHESKRDVASLVSRTRSQRSSPS